MDKVFENVGISLHELEKRVAKASLEIKRIEAEISSTEKKISDVERSFSQIAHRCKIEWFRPRWLGDRIADSLENELKYWLS